MARVIVEGYQVCGGRDSWRFFLLGGRSLLNLCLRSCCCFPLAALPSVTLIHPILIPGRSCRSDPLPARDQVTWSDPSDVLCYLLTYLFLINSSRCMSWQVSENKFQRTNRIESCCITDASGDGLCDSASPCSHSAACNTKDVIGLSSVEHL